MAIDFTKLREPFAPDDVEWRIQSAGVTSAGKAWGIVVAYVTNRAIQTRLDTVVGAENWQNEYSKAPGGGILSGISIYHDDRWITKYDGAENTAIEGVKGGLSSSMKRAAVQWGIGRYLYDVETTFVNMTTDKPEDMNDGWNTHWDKEAKKRYYWKTPKMPDWALPEEQSEEELNKVKEEIRVLARKQGTPDSSIDTRLAEIETLQEARASLKRLKEIS